MRWRSSNLLRYVMPVPELAKRPTRSLNSVQVSFWSQTGLDPRPTPRYLDMARRRLIDRVAWWFGGGDGGGGGVGGIAREALRPHHAAARGPRREAAMAPRTRGWSSTSAAPLCHGTTAIVPHQGTSPPLNPRPQQGPIRSSRRGACHNTDTMASSSGSRPPRPAPPPDLWRLDINGWRLKATLLVGPTCK
jgi:hypothetical protein